jgi:hypothetical protein
MTTTAIASTEEIARFLVTECRKQNFKGVMEKFYGNNIVSVEAMEMPGCPMIKEGIEAVTKASQEWEANNQVHSIEVGEPIISENHFAVTMKLDVTSKMMGNQRMMMEEIAVYEVKAGKIVRQQFFYNTENCNG